MSANLSRRRRRITAAIKRAEPHGGADDLGLDGLDPVQDRYLLVERNVGSASGSQSHWFSTHRSRKAATDAILGQEYPDDWVTVELVDLDANIVYEPELKITWAVRAGG